jgi:hypothetical protein
VVSVGKSVTIPRWANITKPRRKYPEYVCDKNLQLFVVPEELRPQDKAQIVADFEREENRRASGSIIMQNSRTWNTGDGYFLSGVTARKVLLNDLTDESNPEAYLSTGHSMELQEDPLSSQPLDLAMPSLRLRRGDSLPAVRSTMPRQASSPKDTTMPTTPTQPPHPNKPGLTPQKSNKGPTPSPQGQKQNPWEYIPFDVYKSVAYSTGSKRSKSISVSSPTNLRGQELVDNHLILRKREHGILPSTPFQHPPSPTPLEDGISMTKESSSKMDSNPCRPSTKFDQQPGSMIAEYGDASKEAKLRLDRLDDTRNREYDANIASENMQAISSKRKRFSLGSPNTSIGCGESPLGLPPKTAKRTKIVLGDNEVSSCVVPRLKGEAGNQLIMDITACQAQEFMRPRESAIVSPSQESAKRKQRRPSRAMSTRELSSLLAPHKAVMGVNTSFGASFSKSSSTSSTRNLITRQEKVARKPKAELSQGNIPKVIATYKKPVFVIKELDASALQITTQALLQNPPEASQNTNLEPPPDTNESQTARRRTAKGRFAKAKKPEQAVSENITRQQEEGVSMFPEWVIQVSACTQDKI